MGAPIISVLFIFGMRMKELGTKRAILPGPVREQRTFRLFLLVGILMLAGSLTEFLWRGERLRWSTFVAGWVLALASFGLRRKAIAALGKFWSLHVEIRHNHQLVQTGPFRWIRHPTYLSMILELLAVGLILNAIYAQILGFALFLPTLLWRLKLEETALVEKFGEEYRQYQRTTPGLFPYKIPLTK